MDCPNCASANIRICKIKTALGYLQFRCRDCGMQFNERTQTSLNFIQYRTEVVMLAIHYYYRFKNSLDDVVELMAMRGFQLCHQTVHNWIHTFGVASGLKLREKRQGKTSKKWHVDSTYIRAEGRWCYFYRAIDKDGNLIDIYLSDVRSQAAAEAFFKQAKTTVGAAPEQITTDKEPALYQAIKKAFDKKVKHRDSKYMNNRIEQDHRGIKSRTKMMKGFKNIFCALRFCIIYEEIREYFGMKNKMRSVVRSLISSKIKDFNGIFTLVR